ncbi:MAG: type III-A CRISPR-associated protein Cas10/Csm1 [Thiolinea sp.]
MSNSQILDASCRIALAAFLHDLGKFAERARIDEAGIKDADGNQWADLNKQLYCPQYNCRHTHVHAAYTAISMDLLERHLPDLTGEDMTPFKPWKDKGADDSLINAAAMHHKPETFLQWVIATADRVASGFERVTFADYNAAEDELSGKTGKKLNHYTARQLTLVEQITLDEAKRITRSDQFDYCYALEPLSPSALFPQRRDDIEKTGNAEAQNQYRKLWDGFTQALEAIPSTHRHDLSLWLDHFETLWGTYTYAIPSATAGNTMPDVSLYDHSRTTAALAVALWRYHADQQHDENEVREQLRAQWDVKRDQQDTHRDAWSENKFLLIQGDFFGIQNFIFLAGSETQKRAAKLLRGRSFYISLLTECAALKVLDALDLPSTSQVINAAGKFLIVAPNTPEVIARLRQVQTELEQWFLDYSYGQSGVGLAWLPASCNDFRKGKAGTEAPFQKLVKRLFETLELRKYQRMHLIADAATDTAMVFDGFLDAFNNEQGVCAIDGRSPGTEKLKDTDRYISKLAKDQMEIGGYLTKYHRLLITRDTETLRTTPQVKTLGVKVFGYRIAFTDHEQRTGRFKPLVDENALLRAFDFSLPESSTDALWNGYARRYINAYVPKVTDNDLLEEGNGKYAKVSDLLEKDELKTLNHIACDDRKQIGDERWQGQTALMTLKGDVDNLGMIFQQGLGAPTFAKMAALSRQMNAFFAIYLPWLCSQQFPNVYTVFAGGDDFFLIGPWHSTMKLASQMQQDFQRYVANNGEVHFSSGLSMTKPKLPIRYLADTGEEALEDAKSYTDKKTSDTKNAVSCFSQVMSWHDFKDLMERGEKLGQQREQQSLSTGYLYGLLNLVDMREELEQGKPEKALWRSYFSYRTYRMLERKRDLSEQKRKTLHAEMAKDIAEDGIETHKGNYRVALFTHLYQQRD